MFGRKKKKSDLDWKPDADANADGMALSSVADEKKAEKKGRKKSKKAKQGEEPVTSIFHSGPQPSDVWSGLVHPRAVLRFIRQQFLMITAIAMVVAFAGLAVFMMLPSKYSSKALILVDPRQPRVTNSDTVVAGIGGDAAALTSYVEIMKSDGFLSKVVEELGVKDDPDYEGAQNETALISMFRGNFAANRQGATYIVEVIATSRNKELAAKYANGVAEAFVRDQKDYRSNANEEAARWLSERLTLLHGNLKKSEEAVAAYRARNGIVDAGAQGTLDNQQLTSLVSQLGTVTTELADAKARYDQARKDGVPGSARGSQASEFSNLDQLLQEQDRLRREAAELNQTLGSRHPRVLANREQQSIIAGQISRERSRLVERAKQDYETTAAKKQALEGQLADLRQRSITLNQAKVELDNLEREAAANRNLYEQFLARYKITDEQAQFNFSEARIVSRAPVPIKSTKPSVKLVGVALIILGFICGLMVALLRIAFAAPEYKQPMPEESNNSTAHARGMPGAAFAPMPLNASETPVARGSFASSGFAAGYQQTSPAHFATAGSTALAVAPSHQEPEMVDDQQVMADPATELQDEASLAEAAHGAEEDDAQDSSLVSPTIAVEPLPKGDDDEVEAETVAETNMDLDTVVIRLPRRRGEDVNGQSTGPEIAAFFEALDAFVKGRAQSETPSILITSTKPGEALDVTTDMALDYALERGERPVVISLQNQPRHRQQIGGAGAAVIAEPTAAKVEQYEAFDLIPFAADPDFVNAEGLDLAVAEELSGLIDLCQDAYGFVIVEAQHNLTPRGLEDLMDLVESSLLVLESDDLDENNLADWIEWAFEAQVALVLDTQTQS